MYFLSIIFYPETTICKYIQKILELPFDLESTCSVATFSVYVAAISCEVAKKDSKKVKALAFLRFNASLVENLKLKA